jgi:replicative DNA helicase Mcm
MSNEDRSAMHEALEQQTVSISKANIQATLIAQTTVLAAANPKFGRFDPYETMLIKQIDLPPALINRFDLIFPIKDIPDRKKDEKMAKHILGLHQNPDMLFEEIPTETFRKYIAYVKQKAAPTLTDSAIEEIETYYVDLRSTAIGSEEAAKSIPISARQLEAIVRLAEASAKMRLSDKVTKKDARRAIDLLNYSLGQVARDRETGRIDIDVISTGISTSEREKIIKLKEIVNSLEGKFQTTGKNIPVEEIIASAEEQGIRRPEAEEMIEKLKRSGDLFEPKHGFIQKL